MYRDRLRQRVYFPECGDSLASRSFTAHRQRQYGFGRGGANPPPPEGGQGGEGEDIVREGIPAQYRVSFPDILSLLRCPVEGYQGTASSRTNLRAHFSHQHPWGSIVILEEVNQPHNRCPQFDMFFPQEALNWAHPPPAMCRRGLERKLRRLVVVETKDPSRMVNVGRYLESDGEGTIV